MELSDGSRSPSRRNDNDLDQQQEVERTSSNENHQEKSDSARISFQNRVIDPFQNRKKLEKVLNDNDTFKTSAKLSFDRFKNRNGQLDRESLEKLINRLAVNLQLIPIDAETLDEIFIRFDSNEDGYLDFNEFAHLYRRLLGKIKQKYYSNKRIRVGRHLFVGRFALASTNNIHSIFDFKRKIGEGSFGEVHLVTELRSGFTRVCKIINKDQAVIPLEQIEAEIDVLKTLDHPNIIKVFDVYEDYNSIYIVMEHCEGGELLDRIVHAQQRNKTLTESYVSSLMEQILRALAYIHSRRIVHKDLKPDNVLFKDDRVDSPTKIIDFGLAEIFKRNDNYSHNAAGTILYMAPEVFQRRLHLKCDIWSAGCIMYLLLTGILPFQGKTFNEIKTAISTSQPNYERDCRHLSSLAVDLLRRMLTKPARERLTAREALQHPWFKKTPIVQLPPSIRDNLKRYMSQADLKNVLINMMAHQLDFSGKQINHLDAIFNALDKDKNGTLSADELTRGLKQAGLQDWEVAKIIQALDIDDSESVSYTEFLAAAYSWKESELSIVWTAFNKLDTDGDGVISLQEFTDLFLGGSSTNRSAVEGLTDRRLLKRRQDDKEVLKAEVNEMLKQIDKNGDGKVDWEEFLDYVRSHK